MLQALGLIAEKKGLTFEQLESQLLESGGPVFTGVKVDKVKLHDDKSTCVLTILFFFFVCGVHRT